MSTEGLPQRSPAPRLCLPVCVGPSVCRVGGPPVERCMSAMQAGTQMVKLRGSSKGLVRFYFLDEHRSCIRWRPSRKNEKAKSEWGGPGGGSGGQGRARRPAPRGAEDPPRAATGQLKGQQDPEPWKSPGLAHGLSWPWRSSVTSGRSGVRALALLPT